MSCSELSVWVSREYEYTKCLNNALVSLTADNLKRLLTDYGDRAIGKPPQNGWLWSILNSSKVEDHAKMIYSVIFDGGEDQEDQEDQENQKNQENQWSFRKMVYLMSMVFKVEDWDVDRHKIILPLLINKYSSVRRARPKDEWIIFEILKLSVYDLNAKQPRFLNEIPRTQLSHCKQAWCQWYLFADKSCSSSMLYILDWKLEYTFVQFLIPICRSTIQYQWSRYSVAVFLQNNLVDPRIRLYVAATWLDAHNTSVDIDSRVPCQIATWLIIHCGEKIILNMLHPVATEKHSVDLSPQEWMNDILETAWNHNVHVFTRDTDTSIEEYTCVQNWLINPGRPPKEIKKFQSTHIEIVTRVDYLLPPPLVKNNILPFLLITTQNLIQFI
jgi:hypothetical protein